MKTWNITQESQSAMSHDRHDALRILSEYVRSFDTDPEPTPSQDRHWLFAPPPYNQTPIHF